MPDEVQGTETVQTPTPQAAPVQQAAPVTPAATETVAEEPFDRNRAMALIEKLRSENRELGKKAKVADELSAAEQKRKEAEMTELQKLQQRAEEAERRAKALEAKQMRQDAAQKAGLPTVFADRLRGETPEELEADAKAILEALPKPQPTEPAQPKPQPGMRPANPGAKADTGETLEQQRARIHGAAGNPFDPKAAALKGGGVVMSGISKEQ